jgi:hypothetical protein
MLIALLLPAVQMPDPSSELSVEKAGYRTSCTKTAPNKARGKQVGVAVTCTIKLPIGVLKFKPLQGETERLS